MIKELETSNMRYKITELGQIPNHWKVKKLSDLADKNVKNSFNDGDWIESKHMADNGIKLIQTGNIGIGKYIEKSNKKYISENTFEELKCKEVFENDLLICRLASPIGRSCLVPKAENKMITSVDVSIFRPSNEVNRNFINYYLNYEETLFRIATFSSGSTRQRISRKNLGNLLIALPTLSEQKKIVEILWAADKQIEKTDQLIEKTRELKKGLMQQLMSKGIGHNEFKQTDIGEIPVTWKVKSFVELMEPGSEGVKRGPFGGALKKDIFVEDGYAVYEQQHAIYRNFDNIRYFIDELKFEELKTFELKPDDIIVSCSGTIGKIAIMPKQIKQGVMNQALLRFRALKNTVDTLFLYYLLIAEDTQKKMLDMTHGSTIKNLISVSEIKKIKVPLPSYEEQQKIADILLSIDEQIEGYEKEKERQIELKKALMQQLLTGKIQVTV